LTKDAIIKVDGTTMFEYTKVKDSCGF